MLWQRNAEYYMKEQDLSVLLKRVAEGDERAFAALYDATSSLVYGLALRMLGNVRAAEDVVCETYTRAWERAFEYSHNGCAPLTWLVMITRGIALSRLRSGRQNKGSDVSLVMRNSENWMKLNPKRNGVASKRQRSTLMILKPLTLDERQALELAYFSGLKATEIAKHLNQSIGVVKFVMRSGMIKLRAQLESIRKEEKVSTATLLQKG